MVYSIPYIIITLFYGIVATFYPKSSDMPDRQRNIDICCIAVFVLFFGFRGFIGDDWLNYYTYFQNCSLDSFSLNIFSFNEGFVYEPGFTLLVLLCKSIFGSYEVLNIVCCVINIVLLYKFFRRYSSNFPLGLMVYICMGGFLMSINLMRNTIAILLVANALHYIEERKALPYFLVCTLALSFHVSSLFYFPLYLFFHKKLNKWIYLCIFLCGLIFFLSQIKFVSSILSLLLGFFSERLQFLVTIYTEVHATSKSISIGLLERILTGVLIFCYYDKLKTIRESNTLFINSYIVYFFFYFFFWEFEVMSSRLANLFTFFYWVIWPDLLKCFWYENNRRLFVFFLTVYSIFKVIGLSRFITYDYDNILFGAKSYIERYYIHDNYKYGDE